MRPRASADEVAAIVTALAALEQPAKPSRRIAAWTLAGRIKAPIDSLRAYAAGRARRV